MAANDIDKEYFEEIVPIYKMLTGAGRAKVSGLLGIRPCACFARRMATAGHRSLIE